MIVYVEANFLLELARQQEESTYAEEILRLAEERQIGLVLPGLAFSEPFSTLTYYGLDRARFVAAMQRELSELGRLKPHQELAALLRPVGETLLQIRRHEMDRLENVVARLLPIAEVVWLNQRIFQEARTYESDLGLSPQDAIVYASVLSHLLEQPLDQQKCFLNRNSRDFSDPLLTAKLNGRNCRYIAKFGDGLSFIQSSVKSG